MVDNSNTPNSQTRFFVAALLSMIVLFGWSYLYSPPKRPETSANIAGGSTTQPTAEQAPPAAAPTLPATAPDLAADTTPKRTITIRSPLYEVQLDSSGGVATSWIIYRNRGPRGDFPIYGDGSTPQNEKPLQLISDEARKRSPRELPFRLAADDQNLTQLINQRNYQISIPDDTVTLAAGEQTQVEFTLTGDGGVEVKKQFVFRADSYIADLGVTLKQNGQIVPNAKLVLGASIGDQAIAYHNFYRTESEAVAAINGDITRRQGYYSFNYGADNTATLADSGTVDWAGVGDAYFAMAAIPAAPVSGIEYRASRYDVQTPPFYENIFRWVIRSPKTSETRHLISVYLPIAANGSVNKIYTGTKDYFLLSDLNASLSKDVGRPIAIVDLINFSNYWWLRWLTKPLSIPILYALNFFNTLTQNYGVAIVVFTFLFYSLLFPLRWSQSRSFKKAAGNTPKMKEIQDKIKDLQKKGVPVDDPRMRELQMQQLRMTKDAIPIGGCLPMLLQFPLLLAFYTAVTVSLEVRQSSFLWLPDLSDADPWHVLEFAFALSMILSMKFTPTAPAVSPDQQTQQKMMTYFMPVMMLYVMWAAPAGLLIYWFFGNIVSFAQQMLINRLNKTNEPPTTEVVESVPKSAKKIKPKLSTS